MTTGPAETLSLTSPFFQGAVTLSPGAVRLFREEGGQAARQAADLAGGMMSSLLGACLLPGLRQRNTALDWLFYDVGNLTAREFAHLSAVPTREGSILVVWPTGAKGDMGVHPYRDHAALRAAPGRMLDRFTIAGVGSSDVGAAAFARTVADRYGQPVGAIVAGYGIADLLGEAMGGWFVLGAANRAMKLCHDMGQDLRRFAGLWPMLAGLPMPFSRHGAADTGGPVRPGHPDWSVVGRNDTETLLRLLLDTDRTVLSVAGHSKGSLSMAYALDALTDLDDGPALDRARQTRLTTVGAVVTLPDGFGNAGQYLGDIDGFGALNSSLCVPHTRIPGWHHLNTNLPNHTDFAAILAGEPD